LKAVGYTGIRFVDAMTSNLSEDDTRAIIKKEKLDIVGATAMTTVNL
jgi:anaerobic magnesium-protoporphyrin IX monomethyl ester cyclase